MNRYLKDACGLVALIGYDWGYFVLCIQNLVPLCEQVADATLVEVWKLLTEVVPDEPTWIRQRTAFVLPTVVAEAKRRGMMLAKEA